MRERKGGARSTVTRKLPTEERLVLPETGEITVLLGEGVQNVSAKDMGMRVAVRQRGTMENKGAWLSAAEDNRSVGEIAEGEIQSRWLVVIPENTKVKKQGWLKDLLRDISTETVLACSLGKQPLRVVGPYCINVSWAKKLRVQALSDQGDEQTYPERLLQTLVLMGEAKRIELNPKVGGQNSTNTVVQVDEVLVEKLPVGDELEQEVLQWVAEKKSRTNR